MSRATRQNAKDPRGGCGRPTGAAEEVVGVNESGGPKEKMGCLDAATGWIPSAKGTDEQWRLTAKKACTVLSKKRIRLSLCIRVLAG